MEFVRGRNVSPIGRTVLLKLGYNEVVKSLKHWNKYVQLLGQVINSSVITLSTIFQALNLIFQFRVLLHELVAIFRNFIYEHVVLQ